MKGAKQIPKEKLQTVKEFEKLVQDYSIVGIVNMENLPAKQLQNMKEQLRGSVVIRMTKKRLIKIILKNSSASKKEIDKLITYMKGMPAMIFTKANPFKLYKQLDDNKSSAPAKAGQTANNDIIVPAGPTSFSPGPIIGELGALKIKAGIENGKVAIKEPATVVKEGEVVSENAASILTRLGVEPMEVGLDLVAVYEDGEIFTKDVLAIDEKEYNDKVLLAASETFNLAVYIGYTSNETIKPLLSKAYTEAKAIGREQNILADELVGELLAKAEVQMQGLKSKVNLPDVEKPKKTDNKANTEKKDNIDDKITETKDTKNENSDTSDDKASDASDDKASDDKAPDDKALDDKASDDKASDDKASDEAKVSDDKASDDKASDEAKVSDDKASDESNASDDDKASDEAKVSDDKQSEEAKASENKENTDDNVSEVKIEDKDHS